MTRELFKVAEIHDSVDVAEDYPSVYVGENFKDMLEAVVLLMQLLPLVDEQRRRLLQV